MTGDDSLGWTWDKTPFDRLLGKRSGLTGRRARYDMPNSRGPAAGEGSWGPEVGDWRPEEGGGGLRKRA